LKNSSFPIDIKDENRKIEGAFVDEKMKRSSSPMKS
jgi:hypothetical protein